MAAKTPVEIPPKLRNLPKTTNPTFLRNRRAWAKALRSGAYRQTQERLCGRATKVVRDKDGDIEDVKTLKAWGFCCLGVAGDLFVQGIWEPLPHNENEWALVPDAAVGEAGEDFDIEVDGLTGDLADRFAVLFGWNDNIQQEFIGVNDNGFTFEQIAAAIEASCR